MTIALAFWIIWLVWLILGAVNTYRANWVIGGHDICLFLLVTLLGWRVFGAPIHG